LKPLGLAIQRQIGTDHPPTPVLLKFNKVTKIFKKRKELRDPKVLKHIFKLRTEGCGFPAIVESLQKEFDISVSIPTVSNLYSTYLARIKAAKTLQKQTNKTLEDEEDINKVIMGRFDRITNITNKLLEAIEKIGARKDMPPEVFLKYAPTILAVLRENLAQLAFLKHEQEKITINQKNMIYSPLQIMNVLNQQLKDREKEGLVVVHKIDNKSGEVEEPIKNHSKKKREESL